MSLSRFFEVAAVDLRHNIRRPLFWIFVLVIGLSVWGLSSGHMQIASGDSRVGGTKAWLTSEFAVAQTMTFLVFLFYSFFIAVAAGMTVIQDHTHKVGEILQSTPLKPSEYLFGKFFAVSLTFFAILGLHVVFAMFCNHMIPSDVAEEIRGPFVAANYIKPALFFAVPTIWFMLTTSFAVGVWTRSPILIFVLPVALVMGSVFFLWEWSPSWLDPNVNRLLMVIDPAGFRWMNETWLKVDEGVNFYNTASITYDSTFWLNRLWLLGVGGVALAFGMWRYSAQLRGVRVSAKKLSKQKKEHAEPAPEPVTATAIPGYHAGSSNFGASGGAIGFLKGAWVVASAELKELRSSPGLYLFVPLIILQAIGQATFDVGAFDAPLWITPGQLAVNMMGSLTLMVSLLILFYTVESMEREKRNGFSSMFYATPIRTASTFLGKGVANAAVSVAIIGAALAVGLIIIAVQGKVAISLTPFAIVWGGLLFPTFIVWTAFIMAVYSIVGNRYTSYGIALAALIFTGYKLGVGEMNWVGNWYLWGVVQWSDMGLFEIDQTALLLNRIMALTLAVLFIVMALRFFPRAERDASRMGSRFRPKSVLMTALRFLPFAIIPAGVGIALFLQVHGGYQGGPAEKRQKDYWRRNLSTWRDTKPPALRDVRMTLNLEPAQRWLKSEGEYLLVNQQDEPMAQFALTRGSHWKNLEWTMNGEPVEPEDQLGLVIFSPEEKLEPGDSVRVGFAFEGYYPDGITKNGGGASEFVLPSGVVLTSFTPSFAPVVGYDESIGVDDENEYEPKDYPDDFYVGKTPPLFGSGDRLTTHITLIGPAEYQYNSVGAKVRDEVQDGQRTTAWESDHPVNFFNVVAGKWAVREGEGTVVYYHPEHDYNLDEIAEALDASRKYFSEWFMPFPWQKLKLSEFPALANYAQGFPTNITFSENIGFLTKSDENVKLAFMVTAHEAAHQWWGNLLLPGEGPGGNILSEGMAHFSTILLFEEVKGEAARMAFCKRIEEQYGDNRQVDSERPMVEITGAQSGDNTVMYDKGGWVNWMLLNRMGRERALAGIQEFIREYGQGPDFPVLQDYVAVMRRHAEDGDDFDEFVDQWFFDVVVPEYRFSEVERTESGGEWAVTATVTNRGTSLMPVEVAASRGERFPDEEAEQTPRDDEIALGGKDVATLALVGTAHAADEGESEDDDVYRESRTTITLGAGESKTVTIRCDFEPERLDIDPDVMILQLNRDATAYEF